MNHIKKIGFKIFILAFIFLYMESSYSNDLKLSKFRLQGTDVEQIILVDVDTIYWENSWRSDIPGNGYSPPHNHDAIWIFAKYRIGNSPVWHPAKFNPNEGYHGHSPFSELKPVADSMGIFVLRSQNGNGANEFFNFRFAINGREIYKNQGNADFQIFAVEMVYIPQDSFYVGDGATANVTGQLCASDNISPFRIRSESPIMLGGLGPFSMNNRDASGMSTQDDFNNTTFKILPAEFPKGYNSFYCMKYEVTSQQYADFLNSLDSTQAFVRFANAFGIERNAIQKTGNSYSTDAPDRANNFMSWADGAAYTDWIGLRPTTELEMEKICRGPLLPVVNECAWGNYSLVQMTSTEGTDGSGTETALPVNANCNYNLIDGGSGQPVGGPVRAGIFATSFSDRIKSGSSYYGVMEMTGSVWERNVSIGNTTGRLFNGLNGDGLLSPNGNANVLNWPPANSEGSGFKLGNWFRGTERARVSDRFYSSTAIEGRTGHRGFRCVRSSE